MRLAPLGICASREAVRADLEKGTWPVSGRQSGVVKSPYLKAPTSPGALRATYVTSWHCVRSALFAEVT